MYINSDRDILFFVPKLEKALALAGGTYSVADVGDRIAEQKAQLWLRGDAMIVTEIDWYPQKGKVLNFWLACGDMDDLLDLTPEIYEWARAIGCRSATMTGRKGWRRVLAAQGWEQAPTYNYTKDLTDG